MDIQPVLGFSDEDKIGTIQPYDDTLVVILKIGGYDVKRVLVDQGSGAEIMYPDLYKGLNLRSENLTVYDSPLVSFDGKIVVPKGHIRLPVQTGPEVVEIDFIMVDAYSSYTAIVARPWWLSYCIDSRLSPRPLLKGVYSNQKLRRCLLTDEPRRQNVKI